MYIWEWQFPCREDTRAYHNSGTVILVNLYLQRMVMIMHIWECQFPCGKDTRAYNNSLCYGQSMKNWKSLLHLGPLTGVLPMAKPCTQKAKTKLVLWNGAAL